MSDAEDWLSDEQDPALVAEFVLESVQGLQDIESDLLTLESEGNSDSELINRIFRTVHTIKGSGGYLKLGSLVSVAHRAETLLDNIRFGTQEPTPSVTDAILGAIDTIKQMLQTADMGASLDYQATLDKLDTALGKSPNQSPAVKQVSAGSSSSSNARTDDALTAEVIERIQSTITGKAFVYRIDLDLESIQQTVDVKEGLVAAFSSIGTLHHSNLPHEELNRSISGQCVVYLETVLEKDILCDYFGFKTDAVQVIDVAKLVPSSGSAVIANIDSGSVGEQPASAVSSSPNAVMTASPDKTHELTNVDRSKGDGKSDSKDPKAIEQFMRVPVHILHKLLEWTGTMVMARNQLMNEFNFSGNTAFRTLSQAITGVHETVIETRMQTTGSLFERYRRVVRDLARQLDKEVALHIEGGDLELDRTILESFADPLTHLIRNSLDHALETPAEREAAVRIDKATFFCGLMFTAAKSFWLLKMMVEEFRVNAYVRKPSARESLPEKLPID